MSIYQRNMSLTGEPPKALTKGEKISTAIGLTGLLIMVLALFNFNLPYKGIWLTASLLLIFTGIVAFARAQYANKHEGIKNHGVWFKSISSRGLWGWTAAILLTGFYIVLYFYAPLLGQGTDGAQNTGLIALFDPLSYALKGSPASQWFVYGALYTLAILAFGIKFIWKYRHNSYEVIRTSSVMFFQTAFAFLIPEIMARLNGDLPYYDLKNVWPLNYYLFDQWNVDGLLANGSLGLTMLVWGVASILIITPILTFKYGKRWYCSWVCGCGGLAETAGDSFRQLSDKSQKAWKIERWLVHTVLVFSVISTVGVIHSYLGNEGKYWLTRTNFLLGVSVLLTVIFALVMIFKREELRQDARYGAVGFFIVIMSFIGIHFMAGTDSLFFFKHDVVRFTYGFLIGSIFSGVIGTGFYPIMGNRVWCRFGCPMAAILGLQQRLFSKFRITTNGGQCISCGNCSTYCEMGIDVRSYAQKGENIVRASCVGCGICSAVCPRGVLKLENGPLEGRINSDAVLLGQDPDLMALLSDNK
ncbi:MAG: 4Fe-4S dicluster domain-containing protein [Nonlabens sp.]